MCILQQQLNKNLNVLSSLQVVQDAEHELEMIKLETEKSRSHLAQVKLKIREQQKQGTDICDTIWSMEAKVGKCEIEIPVEIGSKNKEIHKKMELYSVT